MNKETISNVIVSICGTYKWTPHYVIENLYVDDYDFLGMIFWYDEVKKQVKKLEELKK